MTLIENASTVATKAWSMRFALLATVFSAAEVVLPMFSDFVPAGTMASLAAFAGIGAMVARMIAQPSMAAALAAANTPPKV